MYLYVDYSGFYGDSRGLSDNCDSCNRCSISGHLTRFRCIRLACKSRFPIHYTTFSSSTQVRSRFKLWRYVSRTCRVRVGEGTDYIYRLQNAYVTRVLCNIIFSCNHPSPEATSALDKSQEALPLSVSRGLIGSLTLNMFIYLPHTLRIGAGTGFVSRLVF